MRRELLLMATWSLSYAVGCDRADESIRIAKSDSASQVAVGTQQSPRDEVVPWLSRVIYLAIPDRFQNGNGSNDNAGIANCFGPADPQKYHGGDIAGIDQRVDYLRDLGVSALWVTPLYKQSVGPASRPCGYHGYWTDFSDPDDGSIEPKLGTKEELTRLLQSLHAVDIKFILDMVVNHAGDNARIVTQHPDWFHAPTTCAALGSPDVNCPYRAGVHDFAQEDPRVAAYLTATSKAWLDRFAIDGIRMDTARYVAPGYFRDSWIPALRAAHKDAFFVGEVFSERVEDLKVYTDAGFDSVFQFALRTALVRAFAKEGSVDVIAATVQQTETTMGHGRSLAIVNMIDNHDVKRFANEPGFGVAESEIVRRQHLALGAIFALPGIPQLYYGDELGLYGGDDPDNRRDMPSWAWTSEGRSGSHVGDAPPNSQSTFSFVQRLIRARHDNAALYRGSYAELWRQNGAYNANVFAFFRGWENNRIVAVFNNSSSMKSVNIPILVNTAIDDSHRKALANGTVFEELIQDGAPQVVTLAGGSLAVSLPGKTLAIYRAK